jgi:predicted Zn-dependent protease
VRAILLLLVAVVAACATNPVTGEREFTLMSESQEIALGRDSDAEVRAEMGVYNDPELAKYVSDLGLALAKLSERPNLPWQFSVVDQPAINAFALPGGFIYITRGILPFLSDEAELAGVLGHEIGHVTARHSVRQYTRTIGGVAALGALGVGARYEASAGWDPEGVPGMLSTLGLLDEADGDSKGIPNWLSTHPEPLTRVAEVKSTVTQLKAGRSDYRTNRDVLERRVDGVIFGDNPEQGITRGATFLHPPLRFRIDFPPKWQIANSPRQVVAKAPDADVFMLLQNVSKPQGQTVRDVALSHMQAAGFRSVSGDRTTINGLDAFVGVYQGQIEGLGEVTSRAAHIAHGGAYYLVAGLVAPPGFEPADGAFTTAIRSFRPLSAAEAEAIRPSRVDFYVVRAGDTWASLAARSGGAIKPSTLAVMNHSARDAEPRVGARIRIVVAG